MLIVVELNYDAYTRDCNCSYVYIFNVHLLYQSYLFSRVLQYTLTNPTWCQKCSMASLGFSAPSPFNFQRPDEWTKWKRRFECFRSASGLSKESETQQVSALPAILYGGTVGQRVELHEHFHRKQAEVFPSNCQI